MSLLEKTRRVNKLLQKSAGYPVDFEEICNILSELINGNVYVVSRKGKSLGTPWWMAMNVMLCRKNSQGGDSTSTMNTC